MNERSQTLQGTNRNREVRESSPFKEEGNAKTLKQYLVDNDSKIRNEVNLLIKKMINNIYFAHIEKRKDEIIFNVGEAAQDKKYANLQIRFSNSFSHPDNLYRANNNNISYFILINCKKNIEETSNFVIDILADKDNEKLKTILSTFIKNKFYLDDKNDQKISSEINDGVDGFYEKIKNYLAPLKQEFEQSAKYAKKYFKSKDSEVGTPDIVAYTIRDLKNNIFGKDEKDFLNRVADNFKTEFKLLSKENREIITKRLNDYYKNHLI